MTGDPRRVNEASLAELKSLSLKGRGQIPAFEETLAHGESPLFESFIPE